MLQQRSKLVIAFALVYVVWGSTYLAIRYSIATIPPFLMVGTRFLIAGAVMLVWTTARAEKRPTRRQVRNAVVAGVLMLVFGNGGVVWAEQTVPSGITALIVAIVPLWLVLLNWARPGGSRPSIGVALGVAVGLFGMLVLVGTDSLRGNGDVKIWGAVVLMFASMSWAAGTLFARGSDLPAPMMTTAIEMLAAGVALLAIGVLSGELRGFSPAQVSHASAFGLVYLILFGSIVGFSAYSWLVKNATPAAVGTYAYVNPVVAVFLGWIIAGEVVSARTLAGAAIIVVAVFVVSISTSTHASRSTIRAAVPRRV
ncbi:MAG: drug/metabolite exporter YedA [Gemmatimonadota bacterium]|nr:drug/metabolite exporter YedA [Gemmatimonadota bacterium]